MNNSTSKEEFDKAVQGFVEHFIKKYPKKKDNEEKHCSRFDHMTPERYKFWKEEHQ